MNNDDKTTKYLEKLKDMKLSESSRARIEGNLQEYARFHTVRVGQDNRSIGQVPKSTFLSRLKEQFPGIFFTRLKPKLMKMYALPLQLVLMLKLNCRQTYSKNV